MSESRIERRDFIRGLAGLGGGAWLTVHASKLRALVDYAAAASPQQAYEFFTPDQAREFDAISAQIVPTDETPGAREAYVVRFVDRFLATVGNEWQPGLLDDFMLLRETLETWKPASDSFAALGDDDQIAFLTEFEKSQPGAFDDFLELTMLGMFSHPIHGGNVNEIGWKMIGFEDRTSWESPFGYYDRV